MPYKLMLVDDERFMLSYLQSCINWQKLDIEIVATAQNGKDAVEQTRLHHPDIVITDIVMPNMYGLEFIKNIYSQFKSTKIIILSGHQNFEFAKEALLYGVVEYLVKPSRVEDIEKAVKNAIRVIESERNSRQRYQQALSDLKRSQLDVQHTLLSLLDQEPSADFEIQLHEKCELLHLHIEDYTIFPIRLLYHIASPQLSFTQSVLADLVKTLENAPSICHCLVSREKKGTYRLLVVTQKVPESFSVVKQLISTWMADCAETGWHLCCALGTACGDWHGVGNGFRRLRALLSVRRCSYDNQLLLLEEENTARQPAAASSAYSWDVYFSALRGCDEEKCCQEINTLFDNAAAAGRSFQDVRHDVQSFLRLMDSTLAAFRSSIAEAAAPRGNIELELLQQENLFELKAGLLFLNRCVLNWVNDHTIVQYPPIVLSAIQIINENYQENLTVTDLANRLHLSPNYLSALFKKHTGTTISEYITRQRIQRAKEIMIENCSIKTYEIADMVGYNDYEYFRKMFKKYVGINPAQYRSSAFPGIKQT